MGDVPQPQPKPQALPGIATDVDGRSGRILATFRDSLLSKLAAANPTVSINSEHGPRIELRVQQIFKSFHTPTHPPYALMIQRAVTELGEEIEASEEAISDFIQREYNDLPWAHVTILGLHLRKLCARGELVCTETGRYKLLADDGNFGAGEEMSRKKNKKLKRGTKTKMHRDIEESMKVGSEGINRENGLGKENKEQEQIRVSELQFNENNEPSRMLEKLDEQITEQSEENGQLTENGLGEENEEQEQIQVSGLQVNGSNEPSRMVEKQDEQITEQSEAHVQSIENGLGKEKEEQEQIQVSELQVNGSNGPSRMVEKQDEQITEQIEANVQSIEVSKKQSNSGKGLVGKTEQQIQSQLQRIKVTEECDEAERRYKLLADDGNFGAGEEMPRKKNKKLKRGTKTKKHRDIEESMKVGSAGINRENGLGKENKEQEQIRVSELQVNGNNEPSRMLEKQDEQITEQREACVQSIEISKEQSNSGKGLVGKTEQQIQSQLQRIEVTEERDEAARIHGKVAETHNVTERLQIGSIEGHIQENNVDSNGQGKEKAEGRLLTEKLGQDGKQHDLAEEQNQVDDTLNESVGQQTKIVPQNMEQLQTQELAESLVSSPNPEPTEALYSSQPTALDLAANLTSSSQYQLTVPILEESPDYIPSTGKELLPTQVQLQASGNGPSETGLDATSKTSASLSYVNAHEHKQPQIWNQGSKTPKPEENLTVGDPVQQPPKQSRGGLTEPKPAADFLEELLSPLDAGILNGQPQGQNTGQGRSPKLAQNAPQLEQQLQPQSGAQSLVNFQDLEPDEKRSQEHNKLQLETQSQIMGRQCILGLSADEKFRMQNLDPKASNFGPDMPSIAITSAEQRTWQQSQTFEPGQQSQTFNGQDWTWEIVSVSGSDFGSVSGRRRSRGHSRGGGRGQGRGRGRPPKLMLSAEQGHLSQPSQSQLLGRPLEQNPEINQSQQQPQSQTCQSQLLGRPLEQNPEINQSQHQPQSQPCQSPLMGRPLEQNPDMNQSQPQLQSQPCQERRLGRPPKPKPELNQSQQQLQSQPIQIRRSERPRKKPEMDQNLRQLPSPTNQVPSLGRILKQAPDIDQNEQQLPSEPVVVRRVGRPRKRKPEMDQSEQQLPGDPYEFGF